METLAGLLMTLLPLLVLAGLFMLGAQIGHIVARVIIRRREASFAHRYACATERDRRRLTEWD